MTHLFVMKSGGEERPEEPEDEKPVLTIGGAQEVFTENLPKKPAIRSFGTSASQTVCPKRSLSDRL